MKIIETLNQIISHYEEMLEVADVQLMNGYTKAWYRQKKSDERNVNFFKKLVKIAEEDKFAGIKTRQLSEYTHPCYVNPELCWSNYRVMLFPDNVTGFVYPFFWTPALGIDNSHYALWKYAMSFRDNDGKPVFDSDYRWGGFYTYGLGNGNQKQLTLYGESSDYPHDKWAEKVKECFLAGKQFLPEIIESEIKEELPF